jgi:hypothetical protein
LYRARDTRLDREVAIKTMPTAFAADPDRMARFEREAKVLAAVNHANIAATIPGISVPLPYGGKVRQVMVDLDPDALYGKGLSVAAPFDGVITARNVDVGASFPLPDPVSGQRAPIPPGRPTFPAEARFFVLRKSESFVFWLRFLKRMHRASA